MGNRPSLVRPSMFMITWHACTWIGLGVVIAAAVGLDRADLRAMGAPLAMMVVLVVLGEMRPIVMTRLAGNPVSISQAFVFAALYLWGWQPAVLLFALSTVLSELLDRSPPWKVPFNTGQYTLSLMAAWLVVLATDHAPSPQARLAEIAVGDLPWIVATWVVFHHVNLALVAGVAGDVGQTFWESFTEEYAFFTIAATAVLALSPLVVAIVLPGSESWALLPLLMLPLLAVQRVAEMSREREHQSLHDPLTDLPNRLLLADRIEQALARRRDLQGGQVAVMLLDVDHFKVINEGMGHLAGDELLIELSRRLRLAVRAGDTLARFGGDEFVVVCERVTGPDQLEELAGRISGCLDEPFTVGDREVTVTASIGVVEAPAGSDAGTLLRDADAAMHRAKAVGRNRTVTFDSAMHHQAARRLDSEGGLRRALAEGQLRVHYQPIVDIDTGRALGVEALVRWQHPERGLIGPGDFIPIAEETGLIVPLGRWVMAEAMGQLSRWRRDLPGCRDLTVAVNLSARQLHSEDLEDAVSRAIREAGLPPKAISLEVTESVVMGEADGARDILNSLRGLGVGLAIDDFGTGYSSLSYLKRLPVTTLKVDRSFTTGLGTQDASDLAIVNAIIGMAAGLGLEVVVEGVETQEQLLDLRRLGPDGAQGFLWSRPLPPDEMAAWLTRAQQ